MSLKKIASVVALAVVVASSGDVLWAADGTWSGEVLDMTCWEKNKSKGAAHAACATKCLKEGQPMGLLLEDGTAVVLVADAASPAAFDAMKEWGGKQVEVSGVLVEKDGKKTVTVKGSKAK